MINIRSLVAIGMTGLLCACATLPSSGPTGSQILKDVTKADGPSDLNIVEVADSASLPPPAARAAASLPDLPPPPTDLIGPGDILDIAIYEAGVSLFGSSQSMSVTTPAFDASAKAHVLQSIRVSDSGDIILPYAGRLHVAGETVPQVQEQVRRALHGFTQNPQVLVTPSNIITNSVIVSGEVGKPGRLALQTNRETLSDVIALSGGYRGKAADLALRVMRGQQSVEMRMDDVLHDAALDVRAYPGDRIALLSDPRTFSILGASGRVDQVAFNRSAISLAEAVATAGGANPNQGDPAAIFVFRYVAGDDGTLKPFVYHLNMMRTGSYFLAQRFAMRDKDVLYVGNARANQPSKVIQLVSQLFSPILTVTSAVQTVKYSR